MILQISSSKKRKLFKYSNLKSSLVKSFQEAFTLSGHCITECTGVGLPQSGIRIFGSQLHTHLTGIKVITRHVRDGEELPPLNYDNHYSTHFQEIRLLPKPVTILPVKKLAKANKYIKIYKNKTDNKVRMNKLNSLWTSHIKIDNNKKIADCSYYKSEIIFRGILW